MPVGFPLTTSSSSGFPRITNLTPANMAKWRVAVAKQRAGQGFAKIALGGDSTFVGYLAAPSPNQYIGAQPYGVAAQLVNMLNRGGGSAGAAQSDMFINDGNVTLNSTTLPQYDSRVTLATGWASLSGGFGFGGNNLSNSTTTTNLTPIGFTPNITFDTIDVFYVNNVASTFNVNLNGTTDLGADISTGNSTAYAKHTYTVTAQNSTVNIYRKTGQSVIIGVDCYLSTAPKIRVFPVAGAGYTASEWSNAGIYSSGVSIGSLIAPDLTFLNLTINDWLQATNVATYTGAMQAAITACLATGSLVLMSGVPSAVTLVPLATQNNYINAVASLAAANNIPFLNMTTEWTSYEYSNPFGLYSNTDHPSLAGYNNTAAALSAIANSRF